MLIDSLAHSLEPNWFLNVSPYLYCIICINPRATIWETLCLEMLQMTMSLNYLQNNYERWCCAVGTFAHLTGGCKLIYFLQIEMWAVLHPPPWTLTTFLSSIPIILSTLHAIRLSLKPWRRQSHNQHWLWHGTEAILQNCSLSKFLMGQSAENT